MSRPRAASTQRSSRSRAHTEATSTSSSSATGSSFLQLHSIDVEHHHGGLAARDLLVGNGVLLWFEVSDVDAAAERAKSVRAEVERDVHVNPNAKQREIWLRDPDGYLVVLAGPSEYRPRT